MGVGVIAFIAGEQKIEKDQKRDPSIGVGEGIVPVFIGILSFVSGVGLTIGGAIHDGSVYRRERRLSLVAPKWNQVGVAYNF